MNVARCICCWYPCALALQLEIFFHALLATSIPAAVCLELSLPLRIGLQSLLLLSGVNFIVEDLAGAAFALVQAAGSLLLCAEGVFDEGNGRTPSWLLRP